MNVTVDRIDLWPRDKEDVEYLPEYEETPYDEAIRGSAWGQQTNGRLHVNIDPGIIVTNDVVPPVLFLGYVGISAISGYVSEFPFLALYSGGWAIYKHPDEIRGYICL